MAALDFPTSPANGDKYPVPAVPGVPIYTWDGEKWTTVGGSVISGVPSSALPLMDNTPAVVGTSTNYTREDHVHPVDTKAVRSDVATLWTPAQQQLARQNAYAAPFDAMMMGGLQINGSFEVSQERGTGLTNQNGYVCDGWRADRSGAMVTNVQQSPTGGVAGFPYCLVVQVATAVASLGASDYMIISQYIEGLRFARLGWGTAQAQPITIGFWTWHHRTGLYSGTVRNGAANRSYAFTYTQAAVDTPQYNTVTIPGDTAGTWPTDNSAAMLLTFSMGSGGNGIAPSAGSWLGGSYSAAPGQINGVAATSDIFRLHGVIVLPGNEAPSAARSPFVMRSYDQELAVCKRYLRLIQPEGAGVAAGTVSAYFTVRHEGLRAAPTAIMTAPALITNVVSAEYVQSAANVTIYQGRADWGQYAFANFTGMTAGAPVLFRLGTDGLLKLDARL
jgi:hypothetical protein